MTERKLIVTKAFGRISDAWYNNVRHIWVEGGTWASKTFSIMQFLAFLCGNSKESIHVSISSETMPHLKRGAMLDFQNILGDEFNQVSWNKSESVYTWPNRSRMEFFSADSPSKALGGRRDIWFANEANHISRDFFRQADMRTRLLTIADWNPEGEFWFHDENLKDEPNTAYIHLTYLDALEVLPDIQRQEIEKYKRLDPNWWNIYGLGITGSIEGLVYPQFKQVDDLPIGDYFYGLDFGFGQYNPDPTKQTGGDPTVLIKNVIIGENLYSKQMFYKREPMTNDDICREMELLHVSQNDPIYPDPNEPKSAEEIRQKGFNVQETEKGPGSVKYGTQKVNQYYQHWTTDSLECIKEQRNFKYIKKIIHGVEQTTEDTTHQWSHGMSARRYAVSSHSMGLSRVAEVQDCRPSRQRR
jgi:phage terminase large subunit